MQTLIAFRYSDEDTKAIEPYLRKTKEVLESRGIKSHCTFFEIEPKSQSYGPKQWMRHAFKIIDNCDFLFVLLLSEQKSEGMLMEVGYCLAKQIPIMVANKAGLNGTYLPEMARVNMQWDDIDNLIKQLETFDFNALLSRA